MPSKGCILYTQSKFGNIRQQNLNGKIEHYAAEIVLMGYNEDTKHFENLHSKIDSALKKYIIDWV
jgi:hypothetical protein